MIGGKMYDFDYSGVTKDRWGQTLNPYMKGLDAVLAQKLQADQEQAYQQGLASLSSPKLDAEDIEVITALQGGQTPEGLASLTTPQVSQVQGGLASLSTPQRRNFEITPEMQQRAVAIDYLTGSQPGTSMNQMIGRYKDLVAAADEKAIGDFERERAYQDTRADKERAYAAQERKEQRDIEKERRDIEKEKRTEMIDSLNKLSGTVKEKEKLSDEAKKRVVERAKKLDPETFDGLTDNAVIEMLKGYNPSTQTLSLNDRLLLRDVDQQNRLQLRKVDQQNKLDLLALQDKIKEKIPLSEKAAPFLGAASRFLEGITNDDSGIGRIEGGTYGTLKSIFDENILDKETISNNRSNLQAVRTNMNIFLREKLQEAGVKSGEINSYIEQARYSYPLEENMSVAQIKTTIDNFIKDMIDGSGIQKITGNKAKTENKKQSVPVKKPGLKKEQKTEYIETKDEYAWD